MLTEAAKVGLEKQEKTEKAATAAEVAPAQFEDAAANEGGEGDGESEQEGISDPEMEPVRDIETSYAEAWDVS